MTTTVLQNRVAFVIIVGHFVALFSLIGFWLLGGFAFQEFTTALAITMPLFANNVTLVVNYYLDNQIQEHDDKLVSRLTSFIATIFPSGLIAMLVFAFALKAFNLGISNFEGFKGFIAIIETTFGVYAAIIAKKLFVTPTNGAMTKSPQQTTS